MKEVIRRYLHSLSLGVGLFIFVMFSLVFPHVTFLNSHYFTFGIKTINLSVDVLLDKQPLYFLLFVLIPALFCIHTLKKQNKNNADTNYLALFATILMLLNNYLFVLSLSSVLPLLKTVRAPLAFIYIVSVLFGFGFIIFNNIVQQGYVKQFLVVETKEEDTQKELAKDANYERLEAKTSTFKFFLMLTAVLAVIFFIVPLVSEMFTIPLGGDFTQQQIPFYTNGYDDWWRFLKTGQFPLWDANTFLGASNVGSNSFYYAFNPFFLPILLVPRALIPQGISLLMIGKFVLAAITMRMYLKYMGVSEKNARLFALIYAFSGWNTYYLWFNHFMEVAVTFPLIMLGIEKVINEKKITLLIFALALMGFANYFFLTTVAVLGVLYAGFRYAQKLPNVSVSVIGLGILGFALGILMSSVVLFPSLAVALSSDRVTGATYLDKLKVAFDTKVWKDVWDIITKWEKQNASFDHKKYYPLISYFFPVLSNRSVALLNTSSYDNTISSLFSFSPVILLFIPSLLNSVKKKKYSHFVALAFFLFALFTPFFYNAFHGFTNEYGRWQLLVPFALITYVAMSLPDIRKFPKSVFDLSLILNLIMMALVVRIAFSYENRNGFSYMYEREYIVFYQFIMLFITYLLFRFSKDEERAYYFRSLLVFFEVAVMGTVTMIGHGYISYKHDVTGGLKNYNNDVAVTRRIETLDHSYYRIFNTNAVRGNDNLPMRAGYNGVSAFHSLYNFELMEFNNWSRINHNSMGWSLGIYERRGLLYDFLQIKYYVLNANDHVINWSNNTKSVAPYKNIPTHYSFVEEVSDDDRFVYKVDETFAVGFGVDYVLSYEEVGASGEPTNLITKRATRGTWVPVENEELYLQSALLSFKDTIAVLKEAPNLGTKTYDTFNRKSYVLNNYNNDLAINYYEFSDRRYPYEAQTRPAENGDIELPTPEFVSMYGEALTYNSAPRYLDGSKHIVEYTKTDDSNFIDGPGEIIINLPLSYYSRGETYWNYGYRVFLYDENYELITFDNHLNALSSASTGWKTLRSFHTPKPVKKITLVPLGSKISKQSTSEHALFIYDAATLASIRESSITNSLTNVKVTTNNITFTTDYEQKKFVVTTIPFDKGWQVKSVDTNGVEIKHPVYKVQGGFVGFLSEVGETNYVMAFTPEYFNIGLLLSVGSLFITIFLAWNMHTYRNNKKRKAFEKEVMADA